MGSRAPKPARAPTLSILPRFFFRSNPPLSFLQAYLGDADAVAALLACGASVDLADGEGGW